MSLIPPETTKLLQGIEKGQDLVVIALDDACRVPFAEEYLQSPYLSNYSTSFGSTCWVQVLPQFQDLMKDAFQAVVDSHRLLNKSSSVQLSPYDLFHGHLFRRSFDQNDIANATNNNTNVQTLKKQEEVATETGAHSMHHQLGILFHCCEYPAVDNPDGILEGISLGYQQIGSSCQPTLDEWKFRNVLWLVGWNDNDDDDDDVGRCRQSLQPHIWLLNGSASEISQLQMDGSEFGPQSPNTVWEGFFVANSGNGMDDNYGGGILADIYHFVEDGSIWCEI